jgi:hypothetical protein
VSIVQVLIQFVFRITFGVALAMGITPPRWVSTGFYRVHLWVLMGLNTLSSLIIYTQSDAVSRGVDDASLLLALAIGLAVCSYLGSVFWLYERVGIGLVLLGILAAGGFAAAVLATGWGDVQAPAHRVIRVCDLVSSGMLLGAAMSAMFLGHWYLNTPTMELSPLRRLVLALIAAVILRALVSGTGLAWHTQASASLAPDFWIFVALRWLAGIAGTLLLAVLTWHTLKIPNTQSATGILYAGMILAFIGELTSQFLSADAAYPL